MRAQFPLPHGQSGNEDVNTWVKVLQGWEELQGCTLPKGETGLLIEALASMQRTMVLQRPRVAVSNTRSPPKLWFPSRKRKKKN